MTFPKNDEKVKDLLHEQQKYLLVICDRYIEFSKSIVESAMKKLPNANSLLTERILTLISQYTTIAKTFVEEG